MFMKKARRKEFDLAILNMAALVKITDHGDKDDTIIEDIKIAFGGSSQLLEYSGMHNNKEMCDLIQQLCDNKVFEIVNLNDLM